MEDNARKFERLSLAMIQAVQAEMKDFHGRLCAMEEGKKLQRSGKSGL
jgi:hypothetical protein